MSVWKKLSPYLLLLLSAFLLFISTLITPLSWIGFVAFVPALVACDKKKTRGWFVYSFFLFFAVHLFIFHWVYVVSRYFGHLSILVSVAAVFGYAFISCWQGCIGWSFYGWLKNRISIRPSLLFALVGACFWHLIPSIFFWDLAVVVSPIRFFVQSLDLIGGFGFDFFLLFFNYEMFVLWQKKRFSKGTAVALLLFAVNLSYGWLRPLYLNSQIEGAPKLGVAMIQPNIESGKKRNRAGIKNSLRKLIGLSEEAIKNHSVDLVVWPEAVLPISYRFDKTLQKIMHAAVDYWQVDLFFGNDDQGNVKGKRKVYNASFYLQPGSNQFQNYRKHMLLAFGEYLPFSEDWPQISDWFPVKIGNMGRGVGPTRLSGANYSFNPLICYESTQADYVRESALLGANFMIELTNDGWFRDSAALYYHKNLAVLRAIENRVGIVRVTNTGITNYVTPLGEEKGLVPIEKETYSFVEVPLERPFSFYTHYAHWLFKIGLVFLTFFLFYSRFD